MIWIEDFVPVFFFFLKRPRIVRNVYILGFFSNVNEIRFEGFAPVFFFWIEKCKWFLSPKIANCAQCLFDVVILGIYSRLTSFLFLFQNGDRPNKDK